jgi:hypothetical protein
MRAQHVAFREMATVGGHDLRDSASEYIAGAAFHLNRRPRRNLRHQVGGCDVWLKAENPIVVVATRKPPIDDFVADCRAAALQALDVASFVALDALGIPWADENYYHWLRTDTAETRLTVLSAVPFGVRTQLAGTVIPADPGATPPSSPTLPDWDPAFRFFRLSQTADDVFEAYRNLYLAFEATMSTVAAGAQSPSITSSRPVSPGSNYPPHRGWASADGSKQPYAVSNHRSISPRLSATATGSQSTGSFESSTTPVAAHSSIQKLEGHRCYRETHTTEPRSRSPQTISPASSWRSGDNTSV